MSVREYVGARYVPIVVGEWDNTKAYEPLMVVIHEGNSYTSRQYVPVGIDILNEQYWVESANYNAQVDAYRKEVHAFDGRIAANANSISAEKTRAEGAEQTLQTNIDAEKTRAEGAEQTLQTNIDAEKTRAQGAEQTLQTNIDAEKTRAQGAEQTLQGNIDAEVTARETADTTIESKIKKLQLLTDSNYEIVERFIIGSSKHNEAPYYGYGVAQGACTFNVNGIDYFLCATDPDNNNYVLVFNMETHELVFQERYALGHANGCSYNGENLVMFANNIDKTIVLLNISNPTALTYQSITIPGSESVVCACFVGNTNKVALIHGQLSGYNFNVTGASIYTDYTLTNLERNVQFDYDSNYYNGWQSVTCDGDYFYITHSQPETIVMIDMSGKTQGYIKIPKIIGHVHADEVESAWIDGEYFYMSILETLDSTLEPERTDNKLIHCCSLVRTNLKNNNKVMREYKSYASNGNFTALLYDPFATFNNDKIAYHNRMVDPIRYGYLFIDDIYACYSIANYEDSLIISISEDYSLHTYMSGNTMLVLNNYGLAAFWCLTGSFIVINSSGHILDYFPRDDAKKYSIICPYAKLFIPSSLTFPDGNTYDVQLNGSILISSKPANEFTIQKVNGSIVSSGL